MSRYVRPSGDAPEYTDALKAQVERLTAELAHMQTMQKVDQRVFEKLRETQDLAEQRWVELGECRKEASAEAADEIERLQRMIDHYEQALKAAFPQGATGMAFEHWNEARKLK